MRLVRCTAATTGKTLSCGSGIHCSLGVSFSDAFTAKNDRRRRAFAIGVSTPALRDASTVNSRSLSAAASSSSASTFTSYPSSRAASALLISVSADARSSLSSASKATLGSGCDRNMEGTSASLTPPCSPFPVPSRSSISATSSRCASAKRAKRCISARQLWQCLCAKSTSATSSRPPSRRRSCAVGGASRRNNDRSRSLELTMRSPSARVLPSVLNNVGGRRVEPSTSSSPLRRDDFQCRGTRSLLKAVTNSRTLSAEYPAEKFIGSELNRCPPSMIPNTMLSRAWARLNPKRRKSVLYS
mmetsp:Transcript_13361/g.41569  ORF Transcript_13361/g.41569 Transcript_13361/m.41569 type:complete len:301 (-) Transcript_13361:912-1814(-)